MIKTKTDNQPKTCPACGASIVSEICAYCGRATGLDTSKSNMDYPVLRCKEVITNFWTIWFPTIFAGAFGVPGLILLIIYITCFRNNILLLLLAVPFFLIGVVASSFVFRTVYRYIKIKTCGKTIQGTVYGYLNDNILINGQPTKTVKLLVQTSNGPRFILYQLGSTFKPYGIYDKVDIKVYNNLFMICKNEEIIK